MILRRKLVQIILADFAWLKWISRNLVSWQLYLLPPFWHQISYPKHSNTTSQEAPQQSPSAGCPEKIWNGSAASVSWDKNPAFCPRVDNAALLITQPKMWRINSWGNTTTSQRATNSPLSWSTFERLMLEMNCLCSEGSLHVVNQHQLDMK